jgi:hypothetical protein
MVAVLQQNPGIEWTDLIEKIEVRKTGAMTWLTSMNKSGPHRSMMTSPLSVCDFRIR